MSVRDLDWEALRKRHMSVAELLQDHMLELSVRQRLQKEYAALSQVVLILDQIATVTQEMSLLIEQEKDAQLDAEFLSLIEAEKGVLRAREDELVCELEERVMPSDPLYGADAFLEIRAGTGGQEAALFAGDLVRMYTMYATRKGWKVSVMSESSTDLGGYREIVLHIQGKSVYGSLVRESGVHRVQRVPATETAGRIHTSTATVAVLPDVEEEEGVKIDPKDLRIDVYRSSGAGGQHVNTTDSAVRITHLPTGIVVACQDERSQHKNKSKALKVLQVRLRAAQEEKLAAEQSAERKRQIGSGDRSEKVRTYNFPQNRVSDHQADVTLKSLDLVMEGHLDAIITALQDLVRRERYGQPVVVGGFVVPSRTDLKE